MTKKILSLLAVGFLMAACSTSKDNVNPDGSFEKTENFQGAVPGSYEDFKAHVPDRVFFDFNSSALTTEGKTTLDRQAEWLAQYPSVDLIVEGHCDIRGTREYNLALGERRAKSVKDYLLSKGVDAKRIHTVSYGKERPEFEGDTEEVHAKNRRGVSVIQ